jgi:hypothetical protein
MRILPLLLSALVLASSCANNTDQASGPRAGAGKDSTATAPAADTVLPAADTATEAGAPLPVASDGKVDLRFNLAEGRTYRYDMKVDMEMQMGERTMGNGSEMNYTMQVLDNNGKTKTIRVRYDKVSMAMNMGGQTLEFSSEMKAGDPSNPMNIAGNMLVAMKGKSFLMKVNERGKITEVTGFDEMAESMIGEMKISDQQKKMMMQSFKAQFNDAAVKEMFGQSFEIFPERPVKVGDSWTRKPAASAGTRQQITTTYTLRSINGATATLDTRSEVVAGEGAAKGSGTGTLQVDMRTGLVTSGNFTQSLEGERKMSSRITVKGRPV